MVDRERNGMARLLQELKRESERRLMSPPDDVRARLRRVTKDPEVRKKTAPHITDAFHLCSDVPEL